MPDEENIQSTASETLEMPVVAKTGVITCGAIVEGYDECSFGGEIHVREIIEI